MHEAVEKAYGHRLNVRSLQAARGLAQSRLVQRSFDRAVVPATLSNADTQVTGNQSAWLVSLYVVQVGSFLATDFEQVAKPCRRDQARRNATMLNQGIGCHGRAVPEERHIGSTGASGFGEPFIEGLHDGARGIVR